MIGKPSPITDADIRAIRDIHNILEARIIDLRHKIMAGAEVQCSDCFGIEVQAGYLQDDEDSEPFAGYATYGVDISWPLESITPLVTCSQTAMRSMHAALRATRTFSGCNTPAEEFIVDLLRDYHEFAITPEYFHGLLAQFEENFGDMVADARRMLKTYPELFKDVA